MFQRWMRTTAASASVLLLTSLASAQSGVISGVVVDESGAGVPAARVTAEGGTSAVTDANGRFVLVGAPGGLAHLVVDKALYARQEADVQGGAADVRVVLAVAGVSETVTVPSAIVDAVARRFEGEPE